jgi:hypothetical protein
MDSNRRVALSAGVLFIVATVASVLALRACRRSNTSLGSQVAQLTPGPELALTGVAGALTAIGLVAFRRRDIQSA